MPVFIFEDKRNFAKQIAQILGQTDEEVKFAFSFEEARKLLPEIGDEDLVFLDSQLPNRQEGDRLAETIRSRGVKAFILWHSSVPAPDPQRLGIFHCELGSRGWLEEVKKFQESWMQRRRAYHYYGISEVERARSEILGPFVLLHLALQVGGEKTNSFISEVSDEEQTAYEEGKRMLERNGLGLKEKFDHLLGATGSNTTVAKLAERQLDEFVGQYAADLYNIFVNLAAKETTNLASENAGHLLSGVQRLSEIVEDGITWRDEVKKIGALRHELENAIIRLGLFVVPLSPQKLEVFKKELGDLSLELSRCINTKLLEPLGNDAKARFEEALKCICELLDYIQTSSDGSETIDLRDKLIKYLRQIIELTIQVVPRSPK